MRVGLDDPQRALPTPAMLGFCDSVKAIHGLTEQPAHADERFPRPGSESLLGQNFSIVTLRSLTLGQSSSLTSFKVRRTHFLGDF